MELIYHDKTGLGLAETQQAEAVRCSLAEFFNGRPKPERVLIIPPDFTRFRSGAGFLTCVYYNELMKTCPVDILPALGTHAPMTEAECAAMYPGIPFDRFIVHDWRHDVVKIGEVDGAYISEISEGLWNEPIDVEVNRLVMDSRYSLIVSVGQVVPHEVIGMANHSKNIFVGVGGSGMINKSHMLGAVYGMERMMGRDRTPVRKVFDYALERFLKDRPIIFALTAATAPENVTIIHGLFIGDTRRVLEEAITAALKYNIDRLDRGIKKCVVYLDPEEFKSTWLGNKAIYRTRMAISDGGELIILAPGVKKFGEDTVNDGLIRKYGYRGRIRTLEQLKSNADLRENMSAAAHLIHGSSDGRFSVTYAVREENLSRAEVEGVGFKYAEYSESTKCYDPEKLKYGWNVLDNGEEVFFIPNPALGLWMADSR